MTRWVYGFDDVDAARAAMAGDWDRVRGLLGGKGANLAGHRARVREGGDPHPRSWSRS